MSKITRACAVAVVAVLGLAIVAAPAFGHEFRKVGKYNFVVGFGDEPPYAGFKNSVQLILSYASNDKPVPAIGDDLSVELQYGDQTEQLGKIEPNFAVGAYGEVGDYRSWFVPSRPGKYTFHLTGTIKGQEIDESFTSSPQGFAEVEDTTAAEFPVKDPTTGQLADRVDREVPRLTSSIDAASDRADSAKTLTIIALVLGAIALIVGLTAMVRGRKTA